LPRLSARLSFAVVAALLREMLSPTVRAWLHVFKAYGTDLKRYLNFVENPSDFIIFKLHRVLRNRRQLLAGLASGKDQQNGGSTAADEMRTSLESEFSREFYRGVDTDAMLTRIGVKASEFFETRTAFAFENPAILAFGLADVKGDAGRTADELVTMARQGSLIGLLEGYANNLHAEVGTEMVRAAIFDDPEYKGIATICHDDMWSLVVKFKAYAATDPNATLWDKPEYRPLIGERPPDSIRTSSECPHLEAPDWNRPRLCRSVRALWQEHPLGQRHRRSERQSDREDSYVGPASPRLNYNPPRFCYRSRFSSIDRLY
jgi:hypothetical protein